MYLGCRFLPIRVREIFSYPTGKKWITSVSMYLSTVKVGLDAGASGDYRAWPSQDGKPQRPEAGQGSGSRAASTHETSLAMGSLPRRPDPQHRDRKSVV